MSDEFPPWPGTVPKLQEQKVPVKEPIKVEQVTPPVTPRVPDKIYQTRYEDITQRLGEEQRCGMTEEEAKQFCTDFMKKYDKRDWTTITLTVVIGVLLIALGYTVGMSHEAIWHWITTNPPPSLGLNLSNLT